MTKSRKILRKKQVVAVAVAGLTMSVIAPTVAVSATTWQARSPQEVAQSVGKVDTVDALAKYQIQWGDTLWALSRATGFGIDAIADTFNISNPNLIFAGRSFAEQNRKPGVGGQVSTSNTYTVAPGDTLLGIARRFSTTVNSLAALNNIANKDLIYVGQVLSVPEVSKPEASEPETSKPKASEPEVSKPEVSKPEASKPEASKPEASKPEASEPETSKPEASEPETSKPEASEPETSKPEVSKPEASKPETSEPETSKPEASKPEASEPVTPKPEASKPKESKPKVSKPETSKPKASKPKASKPETSKPEVSEPVTPKPEDIVDAIVDGDRDVEDIIDAIVDNDNDVENIVDAIADEPIVDINDRSSTAKL